nr:hypothetical protein 2 [Hypera postica associated sobemovirus 3]
MDWPETGSRQEIRSFLEHLRLRKQVKDIPLGNRKYMILYRVLQELESIAYRIPDDFLTYEHFKRVVMNLDWTSSPGYPYVTQGYTNNAQLFRVIDGEPDELVVRAMYQACMLQIQEQKSNYIRVFIKPEPHSFKKIANGRYRLIAGVSVLDSLIDAMLFGEMNDKMMENWMNIAPKIGWTLLYGGWKAVPQINVQAADKTAWDWTVQPWMIDSLKFVRKYLCQNPTKQWLDLVDFRYKQLFEEAEFIFSNGAVLKQRFKGMMKSGCFNTISDNSIAQLILHVRVCDELDLSLGILWSMGDDTLQTKQPVEYFDRLANHCILKQVEPRAEFAGMLFRGCKVEPSYTNKHAYKLLHMDENFRQVRR